MSLITFYLREHRRQCADNSCLEKKLSRTKGNCTYSGGLEENVEFK